MERTDYNPSILEEGFAALAIGGILLTSPLLRPWYGRWGAADEEAGGVLPGDDQVPHPNLESTRAVTVNAPVEAVWPWLVQMGQGRGGLYSYERLENLVGCGMVNADKILPEYQSLRVGDKIRLSQDERTPYFVVTAIEPGRAIILGGDDPPTTWAFIVESLDRKSTRLIARFRQQYEPTFGNKLMWRGVTDPLNFVMERKMLLGIKLRAETMQPA
jgi:hypothetical protein